MPSSNKTPFLNLHQWEKSDRFCMDDFNYDNKTIDNYSKQISEDLSSHISNHTQHIDPPTLQKFNEHLSNQSIHTDISSIINSFYHVGSYIGNGEEQQLITLPFPPSFIIVFSPDRLPITHSKKFSDITIMTHGYVTKDAASPGLSPTTNGFIAKESHITPPNLIYNHLNTKNKSYHYIAFK